MALFWRVDFEAGEAVWLFTGFELPGHDYAADMEVYLDSIHDLLRQTPAETVPAGIQIVGPRAPMPDAAVRKRIGERTAVLPRNDSLYCMVSDNALARGTVTAINWIRRPPFRWAVKRDFADAVAWVAQTRGTPGRHWERFYEEVREEAELAQRRLREFDAPATR